MWEYRKIYWVKGWSISLLMVFRKPPPHFKRLIDLFLNKHHSTAAFFLCLLLIGKEDHIMELWKKAAGPPNVYVISPFTAVKDGIKKVLKDRLKNMNVSAKVLNGWIQNSVGTVHTFQGKEAEIVYFVTGTDENSDGAANWSCSKPNLINVAVTRAKQEFYVIGDYSRFSKKPNYTSIAKNIGKVQGTNQSTINLSVKR